VEHVDEKNWEAFDRYRAGLLTIRPIVLVALCLVSLDSLPASPQKQDSLTPESTLRVTTTVVNVYAIVRDHKGGMVSDLGKDDFELREESEPQPIRYFSRESNTPLSLGMVIDTSRSQEGVLATEQKEAKEFVREVLSSKDQAFLARFDLDVELLQDFTSDFASFARAIDNLEINYAERPFLADPSSGASAGGSHLYDAVFLASNELMKRQVGRKVLVLVTDGEDQGSKVSPSSALAAAEKADVIIYCVAASDPEFYELRGMRFKGDSALRRISERTGGRLIRVNGRQNTAAAFSEIAKELRTEYFLGYSPTNLRHDGSFRKVRVRITHGNYRVQTRHGYYSPKE
jgi:VWFA-related protein